MGKGKCKANLFWRSPDLLEKDQAKNSILHTAAVGGAIRVTALFLVSGSKTD